MRSIYKYAFVDFYEKEGSVGQYADFSMPEDAILLDVQMQVGIITIWAEVDIGKPQQNRTFVVYGTGWDMPNDFRSAMRGYHEYVGTVQDNQFVWHIYEEMP